MRIAMIGQKGIPALYGGVERHAEELALELVKQGHEILAYARAWYTPIIIKNYKGVRVIHTPTIHTKHLDAIVHTFTSTLHAMCTGVDVIHYHGVGPSLIAWMPRIFTPRIKVIATFHCIDRYHQKWNWFARFMLRLGEWAACAFPHTTITVSKTIQNYCINEYQMNTESIPNGVNISDVDYGASALKQWGLQPGKYLLMVSRLIKHKGAHYLIDAWQAARQHYPELLRDYKLAIVGDGVFTENYTKKLKIMAKDDDSVVFTGWQYGAELETLFAHSKLLVHPSENEGLSLSVLQAMAKSKPVLVSDIPEQQEVIADKRFWFVNASSFSLANKIVELIQHPEWLAEAGKNNRQLAENKYGWETIGALTEKIYADAATGKNRLVVKIKNA
ncbi:MAG: glycosyltransferase family 4 protein [bacterium]|nr:glycosyltransferase family 4 protein [bacterium]